jgi:hypothetical protein
MPSIIQDVAILESVAGDIAAFAAGGAVTAKVDGYDVSVKLLAGGPNPQYQAITGSFFQILEIAFADYETFASGGTISIAEKLGNTWYGIEFSKPVTAAPSVTVAPKIEV